MSFEDEGSPSSNDQGMVKFSFKRLELSINRFTQALEIDLDRLHQHQVNIAKFRACDNKKALNREHINSSRTCLQLKSNLRQLERTRSQLEAADLSLFDDRVAEIKMKAVVEVMEFLTHHGNPPSSDAGSPVVCVCLSSYHCGCPEEGACGKDSSLATIHSSTPSEQALSGLEEVELLAEQRQEEAKTQQSWCELEKSLLELNGLVQHFSQSVSTQQDSVDQIEENIDRADEEVQQGVWQLAQASKWKSAMLPIAGAVIGGALAGPIGLFAGLKLGGVAAMGGAITGVTGGLIAKHQQDNAVDMEMQNMARREEENSKMDLL